MSLATCQPIGFIPTLDGKRARVFFEEVLGLHFESDDEFALVFRLGPAYGTMLRVVRAGPFTPAPFTIFGWQVDGIERHVDELIQRGLTFLRFSSFEQDERGIWAAPGGTKIAWFKDPDGNTLSLSEHH